MIDPFGEGSSNVLDLALNTICTRSCVFIVLVRVSLCINGFTGIFYEEVVGEVE